MNPQQGINRLFLLATAPFLGMIIWLASVSWTSLMPELEPLPKPEPAAFSVTAETDQLVEDLGQAAEQAIEIQSLIEKHIDTYAKSTNAVSKMLQTAASLVQLPPIIFDNRVAAVLGKPVGHIASDNIDLKLYSFQDPNYKGYALKVVLKSDNAIKMVLGEDKIGGSETTLSAVQRYGAVAGINAGGYADSRGKRYPLGTTVADGKIVYGFFPSEEDLAFVGFDRNYKLIGGKFTKEEDLLALEPLFGATFVPILLKDGKKQEIPLKWMTQPYRAPRSVVGSFRNGQLLFIVTDGYQKDKLGASLAEVQDLMYRLGIRDAYNLDGGGSATLIFNGKLVNNPSDGTMRRLPTHFLFFK